MARWMGAALAVGAGVLAWRATRRAPADLDGRVALVTGGSRGLGLLIAERLGRLGCRVAICARDPFELASAKERLAAQGITVVAIRCDIARREDVAAMFATIEARLGPVQVLINNAGVIEVGPVSALTMEDFERDMAINYFGAVHCTLAALPAMGREGLGYVTFIDSIGGRVAVPHLLPYTSAKFALRGFAEGLRSELGGMGIQVTTIFPGLMRTGSPANAAFKGDAEKEFAWFALADSLPLLSLDPERAADMVVSSLRRGEAVATLGLPAKALGLLHDLLPGPTMAALAGVNRLLPHGDADVLVRGRDTKSFAHPVMGPLRERGRTTNQLTGPAPGGQAR